MMSQIIDIFQPNHAALAPLAGVTNSVFRRICKEFGARPVMSGMVSSDGFIRSRPGDKTSRLLRFHESERPIGFQFFGANPSVMADAVRKALDLKPDFIDINAGCPVKKVVRKGAGSALLQKPDLLRQIVATAVAVSEVPITVKIRSGWDHKSVNAVEVAQMCEDAGAQGIIIHPRTKSQGFGKVSNWSVIRSVREAVSIMVIGSGDIRTPADAKRMLEVTGADGVMVGRAAMNDPWIFRYISHYLESGEMSTPSSVSDRLELALRQLEMLSDDVSERFAILNMRKFFGWYTRGACGVARFRREVFRAEIKEEVHRVVNEFSKTIKLTELCEHIHSTSV